MIEIDLEAEMAALLRLCGYVVTKKNEPVHGRSMRDFFEYVLDQYPLATSRGEKATISRSMWALRVASGHDYDKPIADVFRVIRSREVFALRNVGKKTVQFLRKAASQYEARP